jgi:type I restriction enzyme S subunit
LQDRYARGALRQHEVRHTGVGRFQYTNFAANERISLPPMEDQRAISATLGALDDKIDSNRRVTSLCWLICATSYRALIDGAPMVELRDLLELKYGKALPERDRRVGEVPVFGSGGHVGHHDAPLIEGPAVIVGRKGSVGSVFYCATGCFPIDTTFYAEPKVGVPILLAYFALKGARLEVMNTDSAVPGLNREAALSRLVPRPATAAVDRWVALAGDLVARANHAEAETRTLMHMRATLLPALMSGQFRVQEARSAKQSG